MSQANHQIDPHAYSGLVPVNDRCLSITIQDVHQKGKDRTRGAVIHGVLYLTTEDALNAIEDWLVQATDCSNIKGEIKV